MISKEINYNDLEEIGRNLITENGRFTYNEDEDLYKLSWFMEGAMDVVDYLKDNWYDLVNYPDNSRQILLIDENNTYDVGKFVNGKYITKLHNPIKWKEII